jgi:uncharacterized protein YndB with AHSA1/START domain
MTLTILATTILFLVGQQKGIAAEQPQPTPTDQPLTAVATVPAPIKDVWKAYTTTDGIIAWMVPKGTVDFRIGGKYVTSYDPKSDLKGSDTIENTILCFDPERMVTIRCTKTPENFPFKRAMSEVWTTVYFRSISESKTEVTCRMIGFDGSDESNRLRDFFKTANQFVLDEMVKYFKSKQPK